MFNEPWEAHAFALAVRLSQAGHFAWSEWTAALSRQIAAAQAAGDPDNADTYYVHWLEALVDLCLAKGLLVPDSLLRRTEAWRAAYIHTPHGQPVELSAAAVEGIDA